MSLVNVVLFTAIYKMPKKSDLYRDALLNHWFKERKKYPRLPPEDDVLENGESGDELEYDSQYWEDENDNSAQNICFDQIILDDELVDNFEFDYNGYGAYPNMSNELDVLRSSVHIIYDDQSGFDLHLGDGYKERKTSNQMVLNDEMLDDFQFDFNAHGAYPIISYESNDAKRSANGEEEFLNSEMEKKTFSSFLRSISWVFCCCFKGQAN